MILYNNKAEFKKLQTAGVFDSRRKPLINNEELNYRLKYGVKNHAAVSNHQIGQRISTEKEDLQKKEDINRKNQVEYISNLQSNIRQGADVVTDVMQLGNFIPHPLAQSVAKAGNIAGALIDGYQTIESYKKGDYVNTGINAASTIIPMALGSNSFRRNSKYMTKSDPLYNLQKRNPTTNPLTNSFKRVNYINLGPLKKKMSVKNLIMNRLLGAGTLIETAYDTNQLNK